jgi:hypothetical protein
LIGLRSIENGGRVAGEFINHNLNLQNMNEAIQQIHNTAMDLSDLARIKKVKEGEAVYRQYLTAAYELELYAVSKIEENNDTNDQLWRAILLKSAGWLAYKYGYLEQAKRLADKGLSIKMNRYVLDKISALKITIEQDLKTQLPNNYHAYYGFLTAANILTNQITLQENNQVLTLNVPENIMKQIARLFLGTTVEIEATETNGKVVLEAIRPTA